MIEDWDGEQQAKLKHVLQKLSDVELEQNKNLAIGGSVALTMFAEKLADMIKLVEAMLSENGSKLVKTVLQDIIIHIKLQYECLEKKAAIAQSIQIKRKIDKIKESN